MEKSKEQKSLEKAYEQKAWYDRMGKFMGDRLG